MRIMKYLTGIWAAIAVYTLFSFFGGPKGLIAFDYLLNEREIQLDNINDLGIINEELDRSKNNLLYDYDTMMVLARQLGYGREDERFIRIVGLGNTLPVPVITGKVYSAQNPNFIPDLNIKITALCAGLLVFAFLLMLEIIEKRTR